MGDVRFKEAQTEAELHQVYRLNHQVFAEEIAQHHAQPDGLLIDRLDRQNRYFLAVRGAAVVGMISVHDGPEFSVSKRLPDPKVMHGFARPFEVRLLAIAPGERNGTLLAGLLWQAYAAAVRDGGSHLLISGIVEREAMYAKLGFCALGPAVREGEACFLPMAMDIRPSNHVTLRRAERFRRHCEGTAARPPSP